ncbi:MAG: ATP-dependent Clp protease ATP-binding subunit [Fimbriimonadaceae bacterium]|nr:ATP-dependent Clp protease ATP-binding subunit [Fimbriimonadaceae bacterium]
MAATDGPAVTPLARAYLATVERLFESDPCPHLGVQHWLRTLLVKYPALLPALSPQCDLLLEEVNVALGRREPGPALSAATLVEQALPRMQSRGTAAVDLDDLAAAVLVAAGWQLGADPAPAAAVVASLGSVAAPSASAPGYDSVEPLGETLRQFAVDLTVAAQAGELAPVVGRDDEIQLVMEVLCRTTKRNPVLVGPAGVGKTAIVEGLAQRLVRGEVPDLLRDRRLLSLPAASLSAGARIVGDLEARVQAVLREAEAVNAILFMDEIHTAVGAGAASSHPTGDVANLLKPALARGAIALIGATTDGEYRRFVEPDAALERRLQPVRVNEPTLAQTLVILRRTRDHLVAKRQVSVSDEVLAWLLDFSSRTMANRFFPDKAIDLLEQCLAHALARSAKEVTLDDATAVAQRVVGMPTEPTQRIAALSAVLGEQGLVTASEATDLERRLQVTLRGLDLHPSRPNAVVLAVGHAAVQAGMLAAGIAEALFGNAERVVRIDLAGLTENHSLSSLIGSGPGYVGYSDQLPLHQVAQTPWCVLLLTDFHLCAWEVRSYLTTALAAGYCTLADGRRVYLSDALILLTAGFGEQETTAVGFRQNTTAAPVDLRQQLAKQLTPSLLEQIDVILAGPDESLADNQAKATRRLLTTLASRYAAQRLEVVWDNSLVAWLAQKTIGAPGPRSNERLLEEQVAPLLIAHLPGSQAPLVQVLVAVDEQGKVQVRRHE